MAANGSGRSRFPILALGVIRFGMNQSAAAGISLAVFRRHPAEGFAS
jgi:hypothetical protein